MLKPKLLLVTSNFYPEFTGIGAYTSDLVFNALSKEFDVTVLTGLPHYPWWSTPAQFSGYRPGISTMTNVKIIRFSHFVPKSVNLITRVIYEFSIWRRAKIALNEALCDFDVVVGFTPSVSSALVARRVSKSNKVPGIIVLQDLAFAALSQSGLSKSFFRFIASSVARVLERYATNWANTKIVISDKMKSAARNELNLLGRIEVIPNYSLFESVDTSHEECRKLINIYPNRFLIIHAGNIGFKQDLSNVVNAAKLLEQDKEVHFLIVGNGSQQNEFINEKSSLSNISFSPLLSADVFPFFLKGADALLINERPSVKEMSLPSKITAYATAGRPVIAAVSAQSASFDLLKDHALIVQPGNPQDLANAIITLKENKELQNSLSERMGSLHTREFNSASAYQRYIAAIMDSLEESAL